MNPLYVNEIVCNLNVQDHCLVISGKPRFRAVFKPREISYDSIILQRAEGSISFEAMHWIVEHAIALTILDWKGNILTQILPSEPVSNELKIAQYRAYLNRNTHLNVARSLVSAKIRRQRDLLRALAPYYSVKTPEVESINAASEDLIRAQEARYALEYFAQFGRICEKIGYEFRGRSPVKSNMRAPDLVNALLNYSYACLQTYVRRAINSVGLDDSIPFLHDMIHATTGLVYDLMELWRVNADYAVLETLELLRSERYRYRSYEILDNYQVMLTEETVKLLFSKLRMRLSVEELLHNCRILAKYLEGRTTILRFDLRPLNVRRDDTEEAKELIETKSARELGMNKSTLWYQKKQLNERGSVRIYRKSKQYFVSAVR